MRARIVVITVDDASTLARASNTLVVFCACIAVIAWVSVVVVQAARYRVTAIGSACIVIVAAYWVQAVTATPLA